MEAGKDQGIPFNASLFTKEVQNLSPEKREEFASAYINRFAGKIVDDTLVRDAGINIKITDPEHLGFAKMAKQSLPLAEMATRLNYCQYLIQAKAHDIILPYTKLRLSANMGISSVKEISTSPEEEIRVVRDPFYANGKENIVRKYSEEDKGKILRADQLMNQATSSVDLGHTIPDLDTVAVLYFVHNKPTQK